MRQIQVRAQTTRASVHKTRATKGMTPAETRYLANWLSTRVERVAGAGALVVASDHAYERALVASRLAKARQLGLTVVPGTYIPPTPTKSGANSRKNDEEEQDEKRPHLVHCRACDLSYVARHLHCCLCGRVLRSASTFERHSRAADCLTDAQLRQRGMVQRAEDGVWAGKPMAEGTRKGLQRIA